MKKHYQKYCMHLAYAIIFTSTFLFTSRAESQEKFSITPELSKQINSKSFSNQIGNAFPVSYKEVEHKIYDTIQVMTNDYKNTLLKIKQLKQEYEKYVNAVQLSKDKAEAIVRISKNIDTFLTSDEKYNIKENVLIESQLLADKYDITVQTVDNRIKLSSFINTSNTTYQQPPMRNVFIYEKDKRSNKDDLKIFKEQIQKIKITEPDKTYQYQEYVNYVRDTLTMQKMEKGTALSNRTSKSISYMIVGESIELTELTGIFVELSGKYQCVVLDNINAQFLKNELIPTTTKYNFKDDQISKSYSIIKKEDTDEYYFITSDSYITELKKIQRTKDFLEIVHKLGYKEYTVDGEQYIKTKTCEISLNEDSYVVFKQNPSWITGLDSNKIALSSLAKQTIPHSTKLNKYIMQWNIQRRKTSTSTINAWRAATIPAIKLDAQIDKLKEKYSSYYFIRVLDKSDTIELFQMNVQASKGVLGM